MYHQFIEPIQSYADVIIPEGVTNTVAIDLITTKIEKSSTKRVRENKIGRRGQSISIVYH